MQAFILLATLLTQDSLTVSPIAFSYHIAEVSDYAADQMPNRISRGKDGNDSNRPVTWHPGLNLNYKTKYTQNSVFYFKDSFGKNAGGIVLGPKIDIFTKHLSVGVIGGVYVREKSPVSKTGFTLEIKKKVQIVPLGGPTLAISFPIGKNVSLETNTTVNHIVLHSTLGTRFEF